MPSWFIRPDFVLALRNQALVHKATLLCNQDWKYVLNCCFLSSSFLLFACTTLPPGLISFAITSRLPVLQGCEYLRSSHLIINFPVSVEMARSNGLATTKVDVDAFASMQTDVWPIRMNGKEFAAAIERRVVRTPASRLSVNVHRSICGPREVCSRAGCSVALSGPALSHTTSHMGKGPRIPVRVWWYRGRVVARGGTIAVVPTSARYTPSAGCQICRTRSKSAFRIANGLRLVLSLRAQALSSITQSCLCVRQVPAGHSRIRLVSREMKTSLAAGESGGVCAEDCAVLVPRGAPRLDFRN